MKTRCLVLSLLIYLFETCSSRAMVGTSPRGFLVTRCEDCLFMPMPHFIDVETEDPKIRHLLHRMTAHKCLSCATLHAWVSTGVSD